MYIKFDPERLAKLTPEQLKIVERWDRNAEERSKIIPIMCDAYNSGDLEKARELGKKLADTDPEYCEHGRHKNSAHCNGCDEIDKILFPEAYNDEE